jgi:hypothetical protein
MRSSHRNESHQDANNFYSVTQALTSIFFAVKQTVKIIARSPGTFVLLGLAVTQVILARAQTIPTTDLVMSFPPLNGTQGNVQLNNVTLVPDRFGRINSAYGFSGTTTSFINISHSDVPVDYQTVSFWMQLPQATSGTVLSYNSGYFNLGINPRYFNPNYSSVITPYDCGDGLLSVIDSELQACGSHNDYSNATAWTHYAISLLFPFELWLYVNGTFIDAKSFENSQTTINLGPGYQIGFNFKGSLDNFLIYSNPLTDEQITEVYEAQSIPPIVNSVSSSSSLSTGLATSSSRLSSSAAQLLLSSSPGSSTISSSSAMLSSSPIASSSSSTVTSSLLVPSSTTSITSPTSSSLLPLSSSILSSSKSSSASQTSSSSNIPESSISLSVTSLASSKTSSARSSTSSIFSGISSLSVTSSKNEFSSSGSSTALATSSSASSTYNTGSGNTSSSTGTSTSQNCSSRSSSLPDYAIALITAGTAGTAFLLGAVGIYKYKKSSAQQENRLREVEIPTSSVSRSVV